MSSGLQHSDGQRDTDQRALVLPGAPQHAGSDADRVGDGGAQPQLVHGRRLRRRRTQLELRRHAPEEMALGRACLLVVALERGRRGSAAPSTWTPRAVPELRFFLNGEDLGVAFRHVQIGAGLLPAASLSHGESCTFVFDQNKMKRVGSMKSKIPDQFYPLENDRADTADPANVRQAGDILRGVEYDGVHPVLSDDFEYCQQVAQRLANEGLLVTVGPADVVSPVDALEANGEKVSVDDSLDSVQVWKGKAVRDFTAELVALSAPPAAPADAAVGRVQGAHPCYSDAAFDAARAGAGGVGGAGRLPRVDTRGRAGDAQRSGQCPRGGCAVQLHLRQRATPASCSSPRPSTARSPCRLTA